MKALKFYGRRDIRFGETDEPNITRDDEVKIKIKACGICGSDISRYAKLGPHVAGMVWGHEFSGEVVAVGAGVTKCRPGQKVTACPALYCGQCRSCRSGAYAQCEKLDVIGAHRYGAFAEYVVLPDKVDYDAAALLEPACVVAHGYFKAGIRPGDTVAIIGCGTIGLLAVQWARIFGARKVIAIDIDDVKLGMALECGADCTVNSLEIEPGDKVYELTGGRGANLAVESAGTPITSAQVFSLAAKGGRVLFLGIPYGDVMIKRLFFEKIVRNELLVYGAWNSLSAPYPGDEWEAAVHFMANGSLKTEPLITHRYMLKDGTAAFEMTAERREHFGKIILHPES